jgi:hypothetical protein
MAINISELTKTAFTGAFNDLFDLFSTEIIINKEPIKTVVENTLAPLYGYGDTSSNTQVTYQPVSGTFSGWILYERGQFGQQSFIDDAKLKIRLDPNKNYIKLKQDGRDFILNDGKVESIMFDQKIWNLTEDFEIQNYLGLQYYYFGVKGTF